MVLNHRVVADARHGSSCLLVELSPPILLLSVSDGIVWVMASTGAKVAGSHDSVDR
jgi:hypothetical protein